MRKITDDPSAKPVEIMQESARCHNAAVEIHQAIRRDLSSAIIKSAYARGLTSLELARQTGLSPATVVRAFNKPDTSVLETLLMLAFFLDITIALKIRTNISPKGKTNG